MTTPTKEKSEYHPYLAARLEWDERYGSLIKSAAAWRQVACYALLLALSLTAAVLTSMYQAKHIQPFVAVVDGSTGRMIAAGGEANLGRDEELIKNALADWVGDWRLVTADKELQRRAVVRAMDRLPRNSRARAAVTDWYKKDPPTDRADKVSVNVDITSKLKIGDATFQIDWVETTREQGEVHRVNMRAALRIAIRPPTSEEDAASNPLGLYIPDVTWTSVTQ